MGTHCLQLRLLQPGPAFQCHALGPGPTPTPLSAHLPTPPSTQTLTRIKTMELVPPTLRKSKLSRARGLSKPEQDKTKDHLEERPIFLGNTPPSLQSSLSCRHDLDGGKLRFQTLGSCCSRQPGRDCGSP